MSNLEAERLVEQYLHRLEAAAAAAGLPRQRQDELVAEIRLHIEEALRAEPVDRAAVRNVLDRLGTPEEIVEAAEPPPATLLDQAGGLRTWPRLELAALAVLAVAGLAALIDLRPAMVGWVIGAVLVLISQKWAGRDKLLALVVLPLLAGALVWISTSAHLRTGSEFLAFGPVLSTPLAIGYLGWRLGRLGRRSPTAQ